MTLTVADQLEISHTLSRYGLLIDRRLLDEWSELWAEDSVMVVPDVGTLRSRSARRKMVENSPLGVHLASPPMLTPGPSDGEATNQQSFLFRNSSTGEILSGWYDDVLGRRGDRWCFTSRVINYL